MNCWNCGAQLRLPEDLNATSMACEFCGVTVTLDEEAIKARAEEQKQRLRQAEAFQRQELDRQRQAAHLEESRARQRLTNFRLGLIMAAVGAVVLAGVGVTGWILLEADLNLPSGDRLENGVARVDSLVQKLAAEGCTKVISTPTAHRNQHTTPLTMYEGGNCLAVIMATAKEERLLATLGPSTAPPTVQVGTGSLSFRYCPTANGDHTLRLASPAEAGFAFALVDCAPEREKYKDDPGSNGVNQIAEQLRAMKEAGCGRVLLNPDTRDTAASMTGTMGKNADCVHLLASTAVPGVTLKATITSPIGELVSEQKGTASIHLVHCPKEAGKYPIAVTPSSVNYYTVASIECPLKVTQKLVP